MTWRPAKRLRHRAVLGAAGLHHFDRVTVAKVEGQIRSVFDFELELMARVLKVDIASLYPGRRALDDALEDLIKGRR